MSKKTLTVNKQKYFYTTEMIKEVNDRLFVTAEEKEKIHNSNNGEGIVGPQGPKGDKGDTGSQGPKGDRGATGSTGMPGLNSRNIEFRKNESNIEWRHSTKVEAVVDYYSSNTNVIVEKKDTVSKLLINNLPYNSKYAQIKTVTIYGVNERGEEISNINPSINTMPEGTTYPSLGGFDPSKGAYDISINKTIEGNMLIQTAIDEMLKEFTSSNVVDIDKIELWLSILNADKEELKVIYVKFLIQKDINNEWEQIVSLSEITGPQGQSGHTPVKGTDYYTEADKEELIAEILKRLSNVENTPQQ